MLGVKLIVLAVLGQATVGAVEPAALVNQLGSTRYAEREAAAAELQHQGRHALPALRKARNAKDPEIQNRAGRLILKIEGDLLTQPTPVRLSFHNATLSDIATSFGRQTGFGLSLHPANLPTWKYQRVSLVTAEPLGFWQALDRLCDVAHLQYLGMHGPLGRRAPAFSLADAPHRTDAPTSDFGPFRVRLIGIHYQRDVNFGAARTDFLTGLEADRPIVIDDRTGAGTAVGRPSKNKPELSEQFDASIVVSAEPRLAIGLQGTARLLDAVDDRGNSLVPPTRAPEHDAIRISAFSEGLISPDVALQVPLVRPISAGTSIKKLRGTIPLEISSRRDDPLIVPLEHAAGKNFGNPDVQITVHDVRARPETRQTVVEISIRASDGSMPDEVSDLLSTTDSQLRSGPHPYQLEITDEANQTVPWLSGFDAETSHVILTLTQLPQASRLKELRYFSLTRGVVQLPFEFNELPMP